MQLCEASLGTWLPLFCTGLPVQKTAFPAQAATYMPCSRWLNLSCCCSDCRTKMWTGRIWLSAYSSWSLI